MQLLPELDVGGVERGTVEIAAALVANGHRAIVVSAGGRLVAELTALGAVHETLTIGRKHVRTLGCIRPLRDLIRTQGVDIVHARSRLPAWIGVQAIKGLSAAERPGWVTTVHGPYTVNAYSRIMTSGDRVIAISEFIREYITGHYARVDPGNIRVIPRGIDRTIYPPATVPDAAWCETFYAQHPQLDGRRLLVAPGRLTRWKGQEEFVAVVARLVREGRPVHGLVAGGDGGRGHFAEDLRKLIAHHNLQAHITLLGNRSDLREILALADIAYSLTIEPEAFGRTTAEALSLGTPVIGYDHGGTGEILRDVLPQGLVPCRDVDAAAAVTARFLDNPPTVPSEHPYTLARMQDATLAVYAELMRERASGNQVVQRAKS
jgi:glycosyltransferase involved in cell wall biosynthesis